MRQYAADQVRVSWTTIATPATAPAGRVSPGLDLTPGLAQGTFIQERRNVDTWNQKPNGVGGVVHLFNPNKSGELTLLIDGSSRTHQELITLHNADLITRSIVGPLVVRDLNTREVNFFNKARIKTMAPLSKGTTATVYSWIFLYELAVRQSFGFDNNLVGS